jgi:hypothetical protein
MGSATRAPHQPVEPVCKKCEVVLGRLGIPDDGVHALDLHDTQQRIYTHRTDGSTNTHALFRQLTRQRMVLEWHQPTTATTLRHAVVSCKVVLGCRNAQRVHTHVTVRATSCKHSNCGVLGSGPLDYLPAL